MVVVDSSKMAENQGLTVHVVKAGDFKGSGTPGTAVTESHLEYYQGLIQAINTDFLAAVQAGRGLDKDRLAAVATGKVYSASDAMASGLIDQIGTVEDALKRTVDMADATSPKPATLQELKSALVGADSDFLLGQLESGVTVQQAQEAWILEQQERLEIAQREAKEATAAAKLAAQRKPEGVEAVGESSATSTSEASALQEWNDAVAGYVKQGMTRQKAVITANKRNPGLREQAVEEYNQIHRG
jgi:ClpP class serine protease